MATSNTVTNKRSALNSQPIPRQSARANGEMERKKQERQISLSDATVVAHWLNVAKALKARASYRRVRNIWEQLGELRSVRLKLKEFGPDPEEWMAAIREHEKKKELLRAGKISQAKSTFPGDRNMDNPDGEKLYQELNLKISSLPQALNKQLHRYVFRPRVDYVRLPGSIPGLQDIWAGGMAPDHRGGWFETKIGGRPVSEADAALALVRLDLSGELHKVDLCKMCKERWFVASKVNYRFCSGKCREQFYTEDPGYLIRKAANQQKYRRNLRIKHASEDAKWTTKRK